MKSSAWRTPIGTGVLSVLMAAVLSACGGGGSDSPPPPPPVVVAPVAATVIPESLAIEGAASSDVASATAFSNSAAALTGLTFAWSFGDGTSSTDVSPKHDYAKVGDYDVTLKVSNTAGVSKDVKFKVSVNNRAHVRGLACTSASDSGWCWQQPRPTGTTREDYFFLDGQTAWSVGENGEIFKTVDGGKNWLKQNSGVQTRLFSIRFADASNGWALGAYGAVLRTTNGGSSWALQAVGLTDSYGLKLQVVDAKTAVVTSGNAGRVRSTSDGGATWTENNFNVTDVAADGTLWSVGYEGLSRSTDGGKTSALALAYVNGSGYNARLSLPAKNVVVTAESTSTYDPSIFQYVYKFKINRSIDNGATWTSYEAQGLPANFYSGDSLRFSDANTVALTAGDAIYFSSDAGRNWTKANAPTNPSFYFAQPRLLDGGAFFSSSYNGDSYLSEDRGVSWTRVALPTTNGLGATIKRLGAKVWLSISGDSASISSDGMLTWTAAGGTDPLLTQRSMLATWFFDAKHGLAFNAMGELQETVNGGLDWTVKVKNIVGGPAYGAARFQFVSATKGWLLASDGRIYRSVDGGALWSTPLTSRNSVSSFHFIDENKGFANSTDVNGRSQLLVSADGGQSWTVKADLPQNLIDLRFSSATQGVGVGAGGRIVSTDDGGATWATRFSGTGSSLFRLTTSDAGTLWAVGSNGTLLKSLDAGTSWTRVLVGSTSSLSNIRFLDAQRGWITGDNGSLLATQDGGKTWTPQYTGTQKSLSDVFFVDARTGWLLGAEGTILATGTGGL